MTPRHRLVPTLVAIAGLALLPACGSSDTEDQTPPAASSSGSAAAEPASKAEDTPQLPVTVSSEDGEEVTVTSTERIIPLDGDVAEIVFALGQGDRVVATDLSATHPEEADALPEIGYQRSLTAEPIAAFEPSVLLGTDVAGPPEALGELRRLGIPLVIVPDPATKDGPAQKIRAVARALGVPQRGEELATTVQGQIDDAAQQGAEQAASGASPRVMTLYLRGAQVQSVLGQGSASDWLIDAAGGVDVAEELDITGSATLEPETLLTAAPDVLLVPQAGLDSVGGVDGVLALPGVSGTPAGKGRHVLAYDDQLLLGGGPRSGEMLSTLVADLHDGAGR